MIDFPLPWESPTDSSRRDACRKRDLSRLLELCSDDHPTPAWFGVKCPRWLAGPPEPCAKFRNHRGPCLRERDITKETPRHAD